MRVEALLPTRSVHEDRETLKASIEGAGPDCKNEDEGPARAANGSIRRLHGSGLGSKRPHLCDLQLESDHQDRRKNR